MPEPLSQGAAMNGERDYGILRAQGVCLSRHGQPVLDHVSLTARPGQLTVLIGPGGAGKTSLLQVLAGRFSPDSGEVWLDCRSLAVLSAPGRGRRLWLDDSTSWRWPGLTLLEVVQRSAQLPQPFWQRWSRIELPEPAAVLDVLDRVGLEGRAGQRLGSLDAVDRIRLGLACALLQDARVLLLDEPGRPLDLVQQHRLQRLLKSLAAEGRTVVQVLRELDCALDYADQLVLLSRGQVLATGRPEDMLACECLNLAYGVPMAAHRDAWGWRLHPVL